MVMNSNSRNERRPEEISVQVPRNCDFIQSRSVMVTFGYSNSIKALADSAFEATKERMSLMTGLSFPIQKQRDGSLSSFLCFIRFQGTVTTEAFSIPGSTLENRAVLPSLPFLFP